MEIVNARLIAKDQKLEDIATKWLNHFERVGGIFKDIWQQKWGSAYPTNSAEMGIFLEEHGTTDLQDWNKEVFSELKKQSLPRSDGKWIDMLFSLL